MKKYFFLLMVPALVLAYLSAPRPLLAAVTLNADTNLELSTAGITLVANSGSTFDSLTVYPSYISLTLTGAQELTLTSSDKRVIQRSGGTQINQEQFTCGTSNSTYYIKTVAADPTQTLTITPTSYSCSGAASGGAVAPAPSSGGTSPAPAPTPTPTPTPAPTPTPTSTPTPVKSERATQLENILTDSSAVVASKSDVLANVGVSENLAAEQVAETKYVAPLVSTAGASVSAAAKTQMVSFVNYGTQTTKRLGAGERAGVLNCFYDVFAKLPETQDDWDDIVKISNGRWPKQINAAKETEAEKVFKKIYLREPDRTNPHDDAAVVIVTYGLKPTHRSLENERAAMKSFIHIYKKTPASNMDWKILRSIAESGATR